MAIVTGGLHGRAAGNVGGVVYGAARTRVGKVVTARELVSPSNPQTAAQVLQRNIFKESLYATRHLTATLWQNDWNRSIGQLPGFQSMMSILLANTNAGEEFLAPADTPLGNLHFPATFTCLGGAGVSGDIDLTNSLELGLNGTVNDIMVVFAIKVAAEADKSRLAEIFITAVDRNDGGSTINVAEAGTQYIVGAYLQGAGTADGLLSLCRWTIVTSKV